MCLSRLIVESVEQLYAFYYETEGSSWRYNPREEFARMGLGTRTKAWRFTDVNKDHEVRHPFGCAKGSFARRIPASWWFRPRSAMRCCCTLPSIEAKQEYLR